MKTANSYLSGLSVLVRSILGLVFSCYTFFSYAQEPVDQTDRYLNNLYEKVHFLQGKTQYEAAAKELQQEARKLGKKNLECEAWNTLADYYFSNQKREKLKIVYDTLVILTKKYNDTEHYYNVSSTLSLSYLQEQKITEAYNICQETLKKANEENNLKGKYISQIMLARFFNATKMNERAIKESKKAIELELQLDDKETFGTGLITGLICSTENESWVNAKELLHQYLHLVKRPKAKASVYGKKAIVDYFYREMKEFKNDLDTIQMLKEEYSVAIRPEDAKTLTVINALIDGKLEKALQESYEISKPLQFTFQTSIFYQMGRPDSMFLINQRRNKFFNDREEMLYESDARKNLLENKVQQLSEENVVLEENNVRLYSNLWFIIWIGVVVVMGIIILSMYLHIKNNKKHNLELLKRNEEVEKANNFKTQFVQNMSHEVRTPLNAICGFSQLLATPELSNSLTEEEKQQYSDIINSSTDMLTSLVNDILDIGDIESGKYRIYMQQIQVNLICKKSLNTVEHRLLGSSVKLKFQTELPDDYSIESDPARIQQILVNFLTNAIKHTEKGSITLSVVSLEGKQVRFSVTDTGEGVSPENAEAIFERFEKLNTFKQGTGLGLPICRALATCMNGKVYLDTTYTEGGARFNLDL